MCDERIEIRQVSIYALLFGLKLQNEKYKEIALGYAKNINNSFDLRLFSMSGLAEAFYDSKDKQLLSFFLAVYDDEKEDEDLRTQCFIGMMKLIGVSSSEIMRKNRNRVVISFDDIDENQFDDEMKLLRKEGL